MSGTRVAYGEVRWKPREFRERIGAAMNVRYSEAGRGATTKSDSIRSLLGSHGILNLKTSSS